jgi:hypothetical protein
MPGRNGIGLDAGELARRKTVWSELSRLWLDKDFDDDELRLIASNLARSGYDLAELERIYRREVAPVVYLNSWIAAGVWAGFDTAWLHAAAQRNAERLTLGTRLWLAFPPTRWLMFYATEANWQRIVSMMADPPSHSGRTWEPGAREGNQDSAAGRPARACDHSAGTASSATIDSAVKQAPYCPTSGTAKAKIIGARR